MVVGWHAGWIRDVDRSWTAALGAMNKLQTAATNVLPDAALAALHRKQSEPQR